jgi:hypothetical protein
MLLLDLKKIPLLSNCAIHFLLPFKHAVKNYVAIIKESPVKITITVLQKRTICLLPASSSFFLFPFSHAHGLLAMIWYVP